MSRIVALALTCLAVFAVACSGEEEPGSTATSAPPTTMPSTGVPATATRPATGPTSTPGFGATAQATLPRVEGTIDPLGFGDTAPVTIKSNPDPITKQAVLRAVRVGAHPEEGGWDRIVFEFTDVQPPGEIKYVESASQCGSGFPVTVQGAANILLVTFWTADAHNDSGQPTVPNQVTGPGGVIVQSRLICDFEAHVEWAVGTKAKQRFKVTRLANPTRLVIDIKQ